MPEPADVATGPVPADTPRATTMAASSGSVEQEGKPLAFMNIGTFLSAAGEHAAAWRFAGEHAVGSRLESYLEPARIAEQGELDFVFLGDVAPNANLPAHAHAGTSGYDRLDPLTLATALAVATRHIGIVATASTTYNDPYTLARRLASLDHLSHGRVGWNVVTTMNASDAYNHGQAVHPPHTQRYARASEFVDVARGLWDSWAPDAFIRDGERGVYFEPDTLTTLGHRGEHFAVRGPLDVARSPQRYPLMVLAGASESGLDLAARCADVVFTTHLSLDACRDFTRELKRRAAAYGRRGSDIKVLAGVVPIVGETRQQADAHWAMLQQRMQLEPALARLSALLGGADLSTVPLDQTIVSLPHGDGLTSRHASLLQWARAHKLSLRQLALEQAGARGHRIVTGTPSDVADALESWWRAGALDGYVLVPPLLPRDLRLFCEHVVPCLKQRGVFKGGLQPQPLRARLGVRQY